MFQSIKMSKPCALEKSQFFQTWVGFYKLLLHTVKLFSSFPSSSCMEVVYPELLLAYLVAMQMLTTKT